LIPSCASTLERFILMTLLIWPLFFKKLKNILLHEENKHKQRNINLLIEFINIFEKYFKNFFIIEFDLKSFLDLMLKEINEFDKFNNNFLFVIHYLNYSNDKNMNQLIKTICLENQNILFELLKSNSFKSLILNIQSIDFIKCVQKKKYFEAFMLMNKMKSVIQLEFPFNVDYNFHFMNNVWQIVLC
jgi:hypothetical protein